jgi:probable F420-dependent oxidoreductase
MARSLSRRPGTDDQDAEGRSVPEPQAAPDIARPAAPRPMTFDVSLSSPYYRFGGIEGLARAAQVADQAGYFAVAMGEHIVTPADPPPYSAGPVYYDFFVLSAHLAALTERVRFVSAVTIVPLRHPVIQAKLWATLDQASKGRAIFGVGLGITEIDQEAVNAPFTFAERGKVTDEYVRAMKILWTEQQPKFSGQYVSFDEIEYEPKCHQQPHVPIWVTGAGGAASVRRAAQIADGWITNKHAPEGLPDRIAQMKDAIRANGRDPENLVVGIGLGVGTEGGAAAKHMFQKYFPDEPADTPAKAIDLIAGYRELGVNHISLRFAWDTPAEFMGKMEWFAAKVMPSFA